MTSERARDFVTELNTIDAYVSEGAPRLRRRRYESLNQVQRDLYDANRFNFECVCGGFGVFFTNSAGDHWRETIDALGRIGALKAQSILQQACALFPGGSPSSDPGVFETQANDSVLQDRFDELARDMDDQEVSNAMEAYWQANLTSLPRGGVAASGRSRKSRLTRRCS